MKCDKWEKGNRDNMALVAWWFVQINTLYRTSRALGWTTPTTKVHIHIIIEKDFLMPRKRTNIDTTTNWKQVSFSELSTVFEMQSLLLYCN